MAPPSCKKSDAQVIFRCRCDRVDLRGSIEARAQHNITKRPRSRLGTSSKTREYPFGAILKKNARDLLINSDNLILSIKNTETDLGILHVYKKKSKPYLRSHETMMVSQPGVHKVGISRNEIPAAKLEAQSLAPVKHLDHIGLESKLKISSLSIVSEFHEKFLSNTHINDSPEGIKKSGEKFGASVPGTSRDYISVHYEGEDLSHKAIIEATLSSDEADSLSLNSDKEYVITSSSYSGRRCRMNTTIVYRDEQARRKATGKLCCPPINRIKPLQFSPRPVEKAKRVDTKKESRAKLKITKKSCNPIVPTPCCPPIKRLKSPNTASGVKASPLPKQKPKVKILSKATPPQPPPKVDKLLPKNMETAPQKIPQAEKKPRVPIVAKQTQLGVNRPEVAPVPGVKPNIVGSKTKMENESDLIKKQTHENQPVKQDVKHQEKLNENKMNEEMMNIEDEVDQEGHAMAWTKSELVDYREPMLTGYFRDQKRRIDIVIVVDDTGDFAIEHIKEVFFRNCLNSGLEFELEPGVMSKNQGLVFVKVHAPDTVILALARHYGVRKYFRENHVEMMQDRVHDERDLIKAIRKNYPGPYSYSTIDRIYLVYRMLRMMPFGKPTNYRGIDRLVERGIIRDAYALHDGPYYMIEQPDYLLTGRQALYEMWVGNENVLKKQPINTVREYLGERIAFLFGYFEMYNFSLLPYFLFGIGIFTSGFFSKSHDHINHSACTNQSYAFANWFTITSWVTTTATYAVSRYRSAWTRFKNITRDCIKEKFFPCPYNYQMSYTVTKYRFLTGKPYYWEFYWTGTLSWAKSVIGSINFFGHTTYNDLPICPKCSDFKACPFVNMTKYCEEVKIKNAIDNPYSIYFIIFSILWCLWLSLKWRKTEHYYYWLWEVREHESLSILRPEYQIQGRRIKTLKIVTKILVIFLTLGFYIGGVIPMLITYLHKTTRQLAYLYKDQTSMIRGSYFMLTMAAALNGFLIIGLELVYTKISFHLNRMMMNQRTEAQYEASLTMTLFAFTLLVNFGFIFYVAFVKGAMYTFPSDEKRWYLPLGLGTKNCGMLSCIDELLIIFVSTHICKKCFIEFDVLFRSHASDMSHGLWHNQHIPCWEKELDLLSFTEADIMKKYNYLMLQLALVTFFAFIFPVAGVLAYLVNFFEIRYWSKVILVYSRRPMPIKTWGMASWRRLLFAMPYLLSMCNVISLARLSNLLPRLMHSSFFPGTRYFADYTMGLFNTSDFYNATFKVSIDADSEMDNTTVINSPSTEWHQYKQAVFNKHLYPHWSTADFCMFPNMYSRRYKSHRWMQVIENSYMPNLNYWHLMWYKMMLVLALEQLTVLLGVVAHMVTDTCDEKVRNSIDVEDIIKASRVAYDQDKKFL